MDSLPTTQGEYTHVVGTTSLAMGMKYHNYYPVRDQNLISQHNLQLSWVWIFDAMETMKFLKFEPHAMPMGVRLGLLLVTLKKDIIKVPKIKGNGRNFMIQHKFMTPCTLCVSKVTEVATAHVIMPGWTL